MTEATKNYVVLSWKPPGEKGLEGVMYYVEKVKYTRTKFVLKLLQISKSAVHYFLHVCLSVCLWHRQLAEGEHGDPSQVSSLCSV